MSVKSKLARQAVKTTAKHTAKGAASKATRQPFRTLSLLALGAACGAVVGWLVGRSGGGGHPDPTTPAPASPGASFNADNSAERASETGAVS